VRWIRVVGIELSMISKPQYESKLEFLRKRLFSHVGTNNPGIRAGHRFREITQAARELIKGRLGYTGPQPHKHDVNEHCLRLPPRTLLAAP
jgi:hypothetical protein